MDGSVPGPPTLGQNAISPDHVSRRSTYCDDSDPNTSNEHDSEHGIENGREPRLKPAKSPMNKITGTGTKTQAKYKPRPSLESHRSTTSVNLMSKLKLEPGHRGFLYWYRASNVLPILAASLGPISNLNSVCALADPWRIDGTTGLLPGDRRWMLGLNAVSLFLGCCANISLFLNFSGRVNYNIAQRISIFGWYCAGVILIALIIAAEYVYFRRPRDASVYSHSEGFWNAVFTAILYICSATLLLVNYMGHLHGMYTASFNLTKLQRRIMLNNVILILWIGFGALLFTYLFKIRYPDAVYFCMITITTIGLGDVVPPDNLSRALVLPFALVALVIVGLIISTIISAVLDSTSEASMLHDIEMHRIRQYENMVKQLESEHEITSQEAFQKIKQVHRSAKRRSRMSAVYLSVIAFSLFWLLGALVFHFCEGWSYFHALYFCSLCLLSIGYGDYHPTSSAGRSFFIIWAIGAVPMMTILISNLSDNVFHWIQLLGDSTMVWLAKVYTVWQESELYRVIFRHSTRHTNSSNRASSQGLLTNLDMDMDMGSTRTNVSANATTNSSNDPQPFTREDEEDRDNEDNNDENNEGTKDGTKDSNDNENSELSQASRMIELIRLVRKLIKINHQDPGRTFTYEQWRKMSKLVKGIDLDDVNSTYWFSEDSPIRYPKRETRYLLIQCLEALEEGLVNMVDELDDNQ